ncbi:uncharacterized protein STEHIDRAFT_121341 [Stereum hirsutum FP-91666 SS1]|uniref:uncharacterized protein n=1 Tax=Stereum hirsutum (strain FP-91666) TaxID=721885 RepID=UPI000441037E|nr:uncharacterized protein STEHIDRAFT_121341 [Stereum hirsutum FP-91666 SS1]EIM86348.1 hypothetical protein STEHIDRAFT_121341 [Stereum hirsutum FP-91666 SS1]
MVSDFGAFELSPFARHASTGNHSLGTEEEQGQTCGCNLNPSASEKIALGRVKAQNWGAGRPAKRPGIGQDLGAIHTTVPMRSRRDNSPAAIVCTVLVVAAD